VVIESIATPALWAAFTLLIFAVLAIDLGVFHRRAHTVGVREALVWTVVWIALSLLFNLGVWLRFGPERGLEFLTGYVIEKALSVDNLFVFLVIFSAFAVPPALQHRVLFWGILGAMALRGVFIFIGAALIHSFAWVMYVFGAFLLYTGAKLLVKRAAEVTPERNPLFHAFRRLVPSVPDYRGSRFTVVEAGRRYATPLLLVLAAVELTDIAFAVDSIPAIFGISADPFIVYTSNIFAILGLRALYFVLAGMMGRFCYLNTGLALVLMFVGAKMLLAEWHKMPIGLSLVVVASLLTGSIAASLLWPPSPKKASGEGGPPLPSLP
jgi:TerC family integral membrane protein